MSIFVIGAATTKFGELWDVSPRTLAREAVGDALSDAGIDKKEVDALLVANMLAGPLGRQQHLGPFFAEELGLGVPAFTIEGACASGGLAIHAAIAGIYSGSYKTAVVLGIEKTTDYKPEDAAAAIMAAGSDEERMSGATFPGLYAMLAQAHMEQYGTTGQELAAVSVKNHFHASLNAHAQFHTILTVDAVMHSPKVADPLTFLECSPISDGASAVILTAKIKDQKSKIKNVEIIASEVATDTLGLAQRESLTELRATKEAAQRAYHVSHLTPNDIDVAEVHDCFTIAEILAMEDLGFYKKGKAAGAILAGETTLDIDSGNQKRQKRDSRNRRLVVNPSGGLKGCGHPVGATGVRQIVEIVQQLRGVAGKRQVRGAKIGLAHNVGGSGATAVVHILKIVHKVES